MGYFGRRLASVRSDVGRRDYLADCRGRRHGRINGYAKDAARIVASGFSPSAIVLFGDTARGRAKEDFRVDIAVIVESGDTDAMWEDILIALAQNDIDGNLLVLTPDQYRVGSKTGYGMTTGRTARGTEPDAVPRQPLYRALHLHITAAGRIHPIPCARRASSVLDRILAAWVSAASSARGTSPVTASHRTASSKSLDP